MKLMTEHNFFKLGALTWAQPGMLDAERFLSVFCPYFKDKIFEDLEIELEIATTDIIKGTLRVFNSGPILRPVLASCAFPFVFAPISIENSLYSDGGIINNFPTASVVSKAEKTLAFT